MLNIYTHSSSPFQKEFWKAVARDITHKYSGPQAVRDSLLRGLSKARIPYVLNPSHPIYDTSIVLSGVAALKNAIDHKKHGRIKKLVAGPNLVVTPNEHDGLLLNEHIDHVLVPSAWVADMYASLTPKIAEKIFVWPSGVADARKSTRTGAIIILNKGNNPDLVHEVKEAVRRTGFAFRFFGYGSFTHDDYLAALSDASLVIYIAASESQGLALQEAWMRDVPTFVHFTGVTDMPSYTWKDGRINAPYLEPEFGAFYKNTSELATLLGRASSFHPKRRCEETLSDSASTNRLLPLIGNHQS